MTNHASYGKTNDESWVRKFAERPNIGVLDYPFIPVPIEEISSYIKQVGFPKKIIDQIETMGYLDQNEEKDICLLAANETEVLEIKVDVSKMEHRCAFKVDVTGFTNGLRYCEEMVKIFGTLRVLNKTPVIVAKAIVPIENDAQCEQILKLTSKLVSRSVDAYYFDPMADRQLRTFISLKGITDLR